MGKIIDAVIAVPDGSGSLRAFEEETAARLNAVRRVRRRAPRAVVRCILICAG